MGLDSVEFILEVEDEFGIKIPDADAEQMSTIGSVVRFIAAQYGVPVPTVPASTRPTIACVTAGKFYALRRVLMQEFQIPRAAVALDARITGLVEPQQRATLRMRLADLGLAKSALRPRDPGALFLTLLLGAVLVAAVATMPLSLTTPGAGVFVMAAIVGASIGVLLLRHRLTRTRVTVRVVARALAEPQLQEIAEKQRAIAADRAIQQERALRNHSLDAHQKAIVDDIRHRICTIASEQFGVARERLSDETHFIRDLEMD